MPRALPAPFCLPPAARRAFTFTEVLFAIILLGIGFIMLAGMFPVAISQTQVTVGETAGAAIVNSAVKQLEQIAYDADFLPTTNTAVPNPPLTQFAALNQAWTTGLVNPPLVPNVNAAANPNFPFWIGSIRGNLISQQDPRFAWTAIYRREPGQRVMQVIIWTLQCRNASAFTNADFIRPEDQTLANLEPRQCKVNSITDHSSEGLPDVLVFDNAGWSHANCAAEGAYVVLAEPFVVNANKTITPGRIYRLGSRVNPGNDLEWELMPGSDVIDPALEEFNAGSGIRAYIMGMGYNNPAAGVPYAGPAMDVGCFTTYIGLK